jgi:hypothetical protein
MRAEWFIDPRLDGPTPFTITAEGQVYGHLCTWQTCHLSYQAECVQPPHHYSDASGMCGICGRGEDTPNHSQADYRYFLLGELEAGAMRVDVGQVTFKTGHAPLKVGAKGATAHYDDTGTCGADVRAGEDEHGCWLAGAVRSLGEDSIREFRGAKLSGDWRAIQGRLELVGVLSVNVPGFPVPRARIASSPHAHAISLVAGASPVDTTLVEHHETMTRLRRESGILREQLHRSVS